MPQAFAAGRPKIGIETFFAAFWVKIRTRRRFAYLVHHIDSPLKGSSL
jgi:hypothetical protein